MNEWIYWENLGEKGFHCCRATKSNNRAHRFFILHSTRVRLAAQPVAQTPLRPAPPPPEPPPTLPRRATFPPPSAAAKTPPDAGDPFLLLVREPYPCPDCRPCGGSGAHCSLFPSPDPMEASSSSAGPAPQPPPSIPPSSDQAVWADASQLVAAACAGKLDARVSRPRPCLLSRQAVNPANWRVLDHACLTSGVVSGRVHIIRSSNARCVFALL
jgi:hypothetical protein